MVAIREVHGCPAQRPRQIIEVERLRRQPGKAWDRGAHGGRQRHQPAIGPGDCAKPRSGQIVAVLDLFLMIRMIVLGEEAVSGLRVALDVRNGRQQQQGTGGNGQQQAPA